MTFRRSRNDGMPADQAGPSMTWASTVRLLESGDAAVRCGGLLGLESFARSGFDPIAVYGVICAFARNRTPRDKYRPGPDEAAPHVGATLVATAASQRTGDYELALDIALRALETCGTAPPLDLRGCLIAERHLENLTMCDLSGTHIAHCTMSGTHDDVRLENARLDVVRTSEAVIRSCRFDGAHLLSASFSSTRIISSSFISTQWRSTSLEDSDLQLSNLAGSSFRDCQLRASTLRQCRLGATSWTSQQDPRDAATACDTDGATWNGAPW